MKRAGAPRLVAVLLALLGITVAAGYRLLWTPSLAAPPAAPEGALRPVDELPVGRTADGWVTADLIAVEAERVVAGHKVRLATYGGAFPGPALRLREGDRVRLRFVNRLPESTSLHLHGLHVPSDVDDPFRIVGPGEEQEFVFVVPADSAGTYWYHTHLHGKVGAQLFGGLAGPIVVQGRIDALTEMVAAEEHLLVLKDVGIADGRAMAGNTRFDLHKMNGREGNLQLVNGQWRPTLRPAKGALRLRLINAGGARYYRLRLDGHQLHLIGTDGGYVERPVAVDELLLAPGERADVLVRLAEPGTFELRNLPYDRGAHSTGGTDHATEVTPLMTVEVPAGLPPPALPTQLASLDRLAPGPEAATRRFVLDHHNTINGLRFEHGRVDADAALGAVEVWEIENESPMDHPFHLHTYSFQVLDRNGVPESLLAWRDVVNVRGGETVRIAVRFRDFVGTTVFHCHIAEHEDDGMMAVIRVRPSTLSPPSPPTRGGHP